MKEEIASENVMFLNDVLDEAYQDYSSIELDESETKNLLYTSKIH